MKWQELKQAVDDMTPIPSGVLEPDDVDGVMFGNRTIEDVTFTGVRFYGCSFAGTTFLKCDLRGVDLEGCNLRGATFVDCQMDASTELEAASRTKDDAPVPGWSVRKVADAEIYFLARRGGYDSRTVEFRPKEPTCN